MKKYVKLISVLLIMLLSSTICFAATPVAKGDATMTLVEDNVNSMTFGKYGEFTKKLEKIDTEQKTIDIRLTAKNNQEILEDKAADIVLLVDTSASMSNNSVTVNGVETTRKDLVIDSAKQLVEKILANKKDTNIGIVGFSTSTEPTEEGTEKDATIITEELTDDLDTLTSAIDTLATTETGDRTDIEIGLDTADKLLNTSTNSSANKYIIVLTDGVPNTAAGVQVDLYTNASADPTKEKLLELKNKGINLISMLISISDNEINISGRPEDATFKTYKDVANYVFGTSLAPTAGVVYYITDNEIVDTVTEDIYEDLIPVNEYVLTDIVIKDYFPKNIIDNFDFALLTEPEIGEVTATVDPSDNSITWTISELKPQETTTFTYRLSLKNEFSSEIVGVNLPTNEDVTIDYKENGTQGEQKHNDKAPIVALDVPAPKEVPLPQTGSNTFMIVGLVAIAGVIAVFSFINLKNNNIK